VFSGFNVFLIDRRVLKFHDEIVIADDVGAMWAANNLDGVGPN
jgi:hypothetical protein